MEIIIGKTSGFCFGVKNAVEKTKQELETKQKIYCLGELVHNKGVVLELEKKGLITVDKIENVSNKETCIIRAHGITKKEYEIAKEKEITLIDLTCPRVLLIHQKAQEYAKQEYYIFLYGKKEHPETKGNASFCGDYFSVISNEQELEIAIKNFYKSNKRKAVILAQTTFSVKDFEKYTQKIQQKLKEIEIKIDNTICNSTNLRQKEVEEIAKKVDYMIIVGGKHSSNTIHLYEISKKYAKEVIHIEEATELEKVNINKNMLIGIMAGASTPQENIQEIIGWLKEY